MSSKSVFLSGGSILDKASPDMSMGLISSASARSPSITPLTLRIVATTSFLTSRAGIVIWLQGCAWSTEVVVETADLEMEDSFRWPAELGIRQI